MEYKIRNGKEKSTAKIKSSLKDLKNSLAYRILKEEPTPPLPSPKRNLTSNEKEGQLLKAGVGVGYEHEET
ncbi:hypothetical protein VNO77_09552 [Canavalia gladiata]|uniref:Uncharacterized protein n=1 Tax=Canavalia gladiata TaxID=3824 RepID=A0AAN9MAW2_CANGL